MADAGQERGLLTPTSLVLSCKQLSSASKLGREKKSQQPLCLAWLSSAAMVPVGTVGGGMGWDGDHQERPRTCRDALGRLPLLTWGLALLPLGAPGVRAGLQNGSQEEQSRLLPLVVGPRGE